MDAQVRENERADHKLAGTTRLTGGLILGRSESLKTFRNVLEGEGPRRKTPKMYTDWLTGVC